MSDKAAKITLLIASQEPAIAFDPAFSDKVLAGLQLSLRATGSELIADSHLNCDA
jgi:hypothetical protein